MEVQHHLKDQLCTAQVVSLDHLIELTVRIEATIAQPDALYPAVTFSDASLVECALPLAKAELVRQI